jgi:hypothetical protein
MKTITPMAMGAAPVFSVTCAHGQFVLTKEQMIAYTTDNPYERFSDGRLKVPDALLEKVKGLVIEEAYGAVKSQGFPNQFAGDWKMLHPGKKLVGRAFTVQFMPLRPESPRPCKARPQRAASGLAQPDRDRHTWAERCDRGRPVRQDGWRHVRRR